MQDSFDERIKGNAPETVKSRGGKGWMICSIVLLALLVGVSVYAIIATVGDKKTNCTGGEVVESGSGADSIKNLQMEVAAKEEKLNKIKEVVGASSIDELTPELVKSKTYDSGYIYLPEAGLKFKIPSGLKSVSYQYNWRTKGFYIWAVPSGFQYYPDFVDPDLNSGSLGAVSVISLKEAEKQKKCEEGSVYTNGTCRKYAFKTDIEDLVIFYTHPQAVYSTDRNVIKDEQDAVEKLKSALTDKNNYSKI